MFYGALVALLFIVGAGLSLVARRGRRAGAPIPSKITTTKTA
jgi:hypothetical protein